MVAGSANATFGILPIAELNATCTFFCRVVCHELISPPSYLQQRFLPDPNAVPSMLLADIKETALQNMSLY